MHRKEVFEEEPEKLYSSILICLKEWESVLNESWALEVVDNDRWSRLKHAI